MIVETFHNPTHMVWRDDNGQAWLRLYLDMLTEVQLLDNELTEMADRLDATAAQVVPNEGSAFSRGETASGRMRRVYPQQTPAGPRWSVSGQDEWVLLVINGGPYQLCLAWDPRRIAYLTPQLRESVALPV